MTLENPEEYFRVLEETASAQIEAISDRLERELPTDLAYMDRVARLRAIRKQAEELVLTDLV